MTKNTEPALTGRSIFVSAPDGLPLHVCEHGAVTSTSTPVVCLPGLSRTTADFDDLARVLAAGKPARRVIALDSRGRGQSAYDPKPKNYTPDVELRDLLEVLNALNIAQAVFVGSSRGGILTMLLAPLRPKMIAGAVLHDIGPKIEVDDQPHHRVRREVRTPSATVRAMRGSIFTWRRRCGLARGLSDNDRPSPGRPSQDVV